MAEHLEGAPADLLAFTGFPKEIWHQLWSNNPLSVNRVLNDTSLLPRRAIAGSGRRFSAR